jgi:hypothetical protein
MNMDQRYMVKQYVAVVQNSRGSRFMVFETGDARWYLFSQLYPGPNLIATGLQFPVLKKDLRDDMRKALRNGWGNAGAVDGVVS